MNAQQAHCTAASHAALQPKFMEHRWGRRIPCGTAVRLSASPGLAGMGRLRDVSMSGAFVETPLRLPLFSTVEIAMPPREDAGGRDIEVAAIVVRTDGDGAGVEWLEMPAAPICPLLGCTVPCAAATSKR